MSKEIPPNNSNRNIIWSWKILLLGSGPEVGKTCLINRFVQNKYEATNPTMGIEFAYKLIQANSYEQEQERNNNSNSWIRLEFWDTSGDERFKSCMRSPMGYQNAIILIYDVSDETSFEKLEYWLDAIDEKHSTRAQPIKMLLGNKIDVTNVEPSCRRISTESGVEFASKHGINLFYEISCKYGTNVPEAWDSLIEALKIQQTERNRPKEEPIVVKSYKNLWGLFNN